MAKRIEMKPVTIRECDFCGKDAPIFHKCAICGREMCASGSGSAHAAYTIAQMRKPPEPHEKDDSRSYDLRICKDCAKETLNMPVGELFDGMMNGSSFKPFLVRKTLLGYKY